jgi:hypothetical protein
MRPETSKRAFEAFMAEQGGSLSELTPSEGIRFMLEFYRRVRAEGVAQLDENGDTLLYEWGNLDWGKGSHFQLDICRQFVDAELRGDDAISQLKLVFYFPPKENQLRLQHGARWCDQPKWLSKLEFFIWENDAYQALATTAPEGLELIYTRN